MKVLLNFSIKLELECISTLKSMRTRCGNASVLINPISCSCLTEKDSDPTVREVS